ncbi:MAG: hypothetical protein AAF447_18490 [Myxococcota bacterium]
MRAVFALLWLSFAGCAAALPALSGGSTTPVHRGDLALGAAARLPTGALRDVALAGSRFREAAERGGVAPVALGRAGLPGGWDAQLLLAGTTLRFAVHHELDPTPASTRWAWLVGAAPYAGWIPDDDGAGRGARFGLDVPLLRTVEVSGLYEAWVGPRLGVEGVRGRFAQEGQDADATAVGLKAGALLGLGLGFRRLHVLAELTVAYERWWGSHGDVRLNRGGVVLTPAFAVRLRI